jgi:CheY-like chemotaxis protein
LLEEAFKENNVACDLTVIMDGDKLMPFLEDTGNLPHVIVLDLNLPKVHGLDLLYLLRNTGDFKKIPVVILSTSASPGDIRFAHENGADRFVTKPCSIHGFKAAVETIVAAARAI